MDTFATIPVLQIKKVLSECICQAFCDKYYKM